MPKNNNKKQGRPSRYTLKLSDIICARISCTESVRSICKDPDMPSQTTIFKWLRIYPNFLRNYTIAKEECADIYAEEIIEIADDSINDYVDGELDNEHVQRSKIRIDARKWVASKLRPTKYGDKVQQEVSGPQGKPIENKWTVEFINAEPQSK